MARLRFVAFLVALGLLVGAMSAHAGIVVRMDENFDGTNIFVDRAWANTYQMNSTDPITLDAVALQGVRVTKYHDGDDEHDDVIADLPVNVVHNGSVSSQRKFSAPNSYRMESGQSISVGGAWAGRNHDTDLFQFALATNMATVGLAPGTEVGHFRVGFSTTSTNPGAAADVTFQLNFVVGPNETLEIRDQTTGALLDSIYGYSSSWAMTTVLINRKAVVSGGNFVPNTGDWWCAYDPFTDTYKGPDPRLEENIVVGGTTIDPAHAFIPSGIRVWVNNTNSAVRDSADLILVHAQIDPTGGWGKAVDADITYPVSWELAAKNNGTLFVDDFYWSPWPGGMTAMDWERGARIAHFDAVTTAEGLPSAADAWFMY